MKHKRTIGCVVVAAVLFACGPTASDRQPGTAADPLPSWNDGATKSAILEFVDTVTGQWQNNFWVRGGCLVGVMPANGPIYAPQHPCACYLEAKLYGFNALATHSAARQKIVDAAVQSERLQRGPAYGAPVETEVANPSDWPTLRADMARSGSVAADVPAKLSAVWSAKIGGRLSSPVAALTTVFRYRYWRIWIWNTMQACFR